MNRIKIEFRLAENPELMKLINKIINPSYSAEDGSIITGSGYTANFVISKNKSALSDDLITTFNQVIDLLREQNLTSDNTDDKSRNTITFNINVPVTTDSKYRSLAYIARKLMSKIFNHMDGVSVWHRDFIDDDDPDSFTVVGIDIDFSKSSSPSLLLDRTENLFILLTDSSEYNKMLNDKYSDNKDRSVFTTTMPEYEEDVSHIIDKLSGIITHGDIEECFHLIFKE